MVDFGGELHEADSCSSRVDVQSFHDGRNEVDFFLEVLRWRHADAEVKMVKETEAPAHDEDHVDGHRLFAACLRLIKRD